MSVPTAGPQGTLAVSGAAPAEVLDAGRVSLAFSELWSCACLSQFLFCLSPFFLSWPWTQYYPIFNSYWESGNQFLMDDTELQNLVKELSLHVMAAINDMSCPLYMSVLLCVVYSWSPGWTYTINSTIPLLLDFQVISGPAVCRN